MIEIQGVSKRFGSKVAVSDLSLKIPAGEVFAFLGPNGAGKTTTIKMMVGLLQPSEGSLSINGFDVVAEPREVNLRTGYVPDEPYLYEKLSGREFLRFIADIYGLSRTDAEQGIEQQIEAFQLASFIDQLTESYSHGMKQRLVFAAAWLHKPDVFIVDEPMVGLDPRSMRFVKDLLQAQAQDGATVFMSTHTLAVAEEIADRIGVINHGRLIFLGTVDELRQHLSSTESLEQLFLTLTDKTTPGELADDRNWQLEAF